MRSADLNVIGAGYVGLVTAACLARQTGAHVHVVETDSERLSLLSKRRAPFREPGLDALLSSTKISFGPEAVKAGTHILCVGTPPAPDGSADLRALVEAARSLRRVFANGRGRQVVAVKSTVPPGTLDGPVRAVFADLKNVHLASNPEFLREGSAVSDGLRPDRILIGTHSEIAWETLESLYRPFRGAAIVRCRPAEAELGKYANNALLAMLISFSNELSRIADTPALSSQLGIDRVLELVLLDRRWRDGAEGIPPSITQYLRSGCGFGGSCFPKDVAALAALARANQVPAPLLAGILPANRAAQAAWADRAMAEAQETRGTRPKVIALLGLAFKPGTDDVRESPALGLIERIARSGARIQVHDPQATLPRSHLRSGRVAQLSDAKGALRGADACVLVTAWDEYKTLREGDFETLMRNPVLLDGRGLYRDRRFRRLRYVRIGTRA